MHKNNGQISLFLKKFYAWSVTTTRTCPVMNLYSDHLVKLFSLEPFPPPPTLFLSFLFFRSCVLILGSGKENSTFKNGVWIWESIISGLSSRHTLSIEEIKCFLSPGCLRTYLRGMHSVSTKYSLSFPKPALYVRHCVSPWTDRWRWQKPRPWP